MRLTEFTTQNVAEGYYDLNDPDLSMNPIDLSANPSFKEIVQRYTQLVYQGHASETSPEEDQEYDDIEKYVAQRFGPKGSAHLQKAGEVSYWGRDDKPYGRDSHSSNLGRPNQPGGDFRTTKAGKMHGQDAKMMKNKVAGRLGRHPEPNLPEGYLDNPGQQDSPVASAITRRILLQRTDLLAKYGPEKVGAAVDEVADFVGDVDEIGSSDVSSWVRHVEQMLGNMGDEQGVAEGASTTWEVSYDYGPHMTKSVTVKAGSEEEARAKVEKAAEKKGMSIMINSVEPAQQGVAEGGGGRDSWDSNMPGYQGDYGGADNWGRRSREDDEHHEIDRRMEQQAASGTWYITIDGKLLKNKEGQPFTFVGKAAATKAAQTMMAKPFNQGKKFMLTTKGV